MNWKQAFVSYYTTSIRFISFVIHRFLQDECTYIASALAFTSLLAIVPLMSVGLAIFSSFPVFQGLADPLQNFIFDNFVPATGKIIQVYLLQFTSQVTKLSFWGIAFVILTALLVMFTIEQAMNKIWRVTSARHGASAFLLYWAILSLAPLLLGLSLAASSYILSIPLIKGANTPFFVINYAPFLFSLGSFMLLYTIVPNCSVKLRHAFFGSLFAAILFETAKHAFAYYLNRFDTYELLYGAFASVPIIFIWVYWVWLITLLGAEISYALSVNHQRREGFALDGFSHAALWLYHLWIAQQQGKGLNFNQLVTASTQPFNVDVDEMIQILIRKKLIHISAEGDFMLSRDLSLITVYELTQMLPYHIPTEIEVAQSNLIFGGKELLEKNNQILAKSLSISLEQWFMTKAS